MALSFEADTPKVNAGSALDAALGNIADALVTVDSMGIIRFASAGALNLLGYDRSTALGESVFTYLHVDDVDDAVQLFMHRLEYSGADLGHQMRLRHALGHWIHVTVTVGLLPDTDLGVAAITLRPSDAAYHHVDLLQRQLAVEEFCVGLGASFMDATTSGEVLDCLETSLGDIGLLTGSHVVSVFVERAQRNVLERLARWTTPDLAHVPGMASIDKGLDAQATEIVLTDALLINDVGEYWQGDNRLSDDVSVTSFLSAPFDTGTQRGVVAALRMSPGQPWHDEDAQLVSRTAELLARVLKISRSEELLSLTYAAGPIGFSIRTWAGAFVDCNQQYLDLLQLERSDAETKNLSDVLHPADKTAVAQALQGLQQGATDKFTLDCRIVRPDHTTRWIRCNAVRLDTAGWDEPLVLTSLEDVSEMHEQRAALEHSVRHDSLTGLPNRDELWSRIGQFSADHGRLPHLLILDLDRFKVTNDSLGHSVGDEVLCAFADRLTTHSGSLDLVARLGSDEFAIMVNDSQRARVDQLVAGLRFAMQGPLVAGGRSVHQTMSIGAADGSSASTAAELMVQADLAMYAAKANGRNSYAIFDPSMRKDLDGALALERELCGAIAKNEFAIYFQPEFTTGDRRIVGAEALLRWHHPEQGVLSATTFIDVAEQSGLIDDLGRFALRDACQSFERILAELDYPELKLRVNISAREFARPELAELVEAALRDSGLSADRLCLEMTEMTLMDSPEIALETFDGLHALGVEFAIDDFGTGYSSLIYLKRFPVDSLKVDMRFIEDITTNSDSVAIVDSILRLALALDLDVVAEGVETGQQLDLLRSLGCDSAQGYLVAPALDPDAFIALIKAQDLP